MHSLVVYKLRTPSILVVLARNTPFHTPPYHRKVSVALHTCVRHDNAKHEKNRTFSISVHWGVYEIKTVRNKLSTSCSACGGMHGTCEGRESGRGERERYGGGGGGGGGGRWGEREKEKERR